MADYAYIGTAAEKVFGHEAGSFMRAYDKLKQGTNDLVLEAEPVAQVTCAFIREQRNGLEGQPIYSKSWTRKQTRRYSG